MGMQGMGMQQQGPQPEMPQHDTSETIHISSLALLKMMKHCKAGVPFEVMGLMLGQVIDDYTIHVVDVFSMPQMGTTVSVEATDPVYTLNMVEMLKQVGRSETKVGWYHSHPGFGCWLSGVDVQTAQSHEQEGPRSVSVVVDPVQSVRGKVVIDAFRTIEPNFMRMGMDPRQITANVGHIKPPNKSAAIHGLGRLYYSMPIAYRKNEFEQKMLGNLNKRGWTNHLKMDDFCDHHAENIKKLKEYSKLTEQYNKWI